MRILDHWIDGKPDVNNRGDYFSSTSPDSRDVIAQVRLGQAEDADRAVASSLTAKEAWAALAPGERGRVLMAIGQAIRASADELVDAEMSETGKFRHSAKADVELAADNFEFYGGVIRALFGDVIDVGSGQRAFTVREPYGVIAVITPWNSPLFLASRGVAAALAAGNVVIIKPSEFTSSTTVMLARIATQAGLPAGVFNVVLGTGPEAGAALVRHPDVRKAAFTGSVASGRAVARICAERLIPVSLELGGKSPNIVFADADLDTAARFAAAYTRNCGQFCSALTRLLVERSVHDEMVDKVVRIVDAIEPGKDMPALTTEAQFEKVQNYFDIAREEGARLEVGGPGVGDDALLRGRYVRPTVYTGVKPQMRIFREEIFGPVLAVTPFDDEEEAISLANDSDYGLVSNLFTNDVSRALRVAARLQSGQVTVNGASAGNDVPFGGYKNSGIGRERGFEALHDYTQVKAIVIKAEAG